MKAYFLWWALKNNPSLYATYNKTTLLKYDYEHNIIWKTSSLHLKYCLYFATQSNNAIKGIYGLFKYQSVGSRNLLSYYTPPIPF